MTKIILYILGAVLTLVGIIGFFNDPVFGIFEVDMAHNIIHIISGLSALYFATRLYLAPMYGKIMAAVYAIVAVWGLLEPTGNVLGMYMNSADHILHVALTAVYLYIGFAPERSGAGSIRRTA